MEKITLLLFNILFMLTARGQDMTASGKWNLELNASLLTGITHHYDEYAYRSREINKKNTLSPIGLGLKMNFVFDKNLVISSGLGLEFRKFKTHSFFDKSRIPLSRRSTTRELVHSKSITYMYFSLPVDIGYRINFDKYTLELFCGGKLQYLWNGKYDVGYIKYNGWGIANRYYFGYALMSGCRNIFKMTEKLDFVLSTGVSIINVDRKDPILFKQSNSGDDRVSITHKYLEFQLGVNYQL